MKRNAPKAVPLGELVVAFFDIAAQYSTDPLEISRLASKAVLARLRRALETAPTSMSANFFVVGAAS